MKNLFKFEFRKLFRQKSFYICTAVIVAMALLVLAMNKVTLVQSGPATPMPAPVQAVLSTISSSTFTMVCGIFIALFICTDYDNQTIKNIYARGFSKEKVYLAKFITSMIATTIMFAVTLIVSYVVSSCLFNGTAEKGNYVGLFIGQLVYCLTYSAFVFSISFALRKVGVSIAVAIVGPGIITLVLTLLDSFLKLKTFKITSYWFDGFITDFSTLATTDTRLITCILLSLAYCALFVLPGIFLGKKKDVM